VIILDDVSITLRGVRIIRNLNLKFQPREMALLVGPNEMILDGILSSVCGQFAPDDGTIEIDGFSVLSDDAKRKMVCVFERPLMNPFLTPRKNLEFYSKLRGIKSVSSVELDSYAKRLLLHEFVDSNVSELGRGIARGFEILEALIVKPEYFVLCDFTASLFATSIRKMPDEFSNLLQTRTGIISSTPSLEFARSLSNHIPIRVIVITEEGVFVDGSFNEIVNELSANVALRIEPSRNQPKSYEIAKAIEALEK
jgi:ABC-type multidrug transport system ATPase subunit